MLVCLIILSLLPSVLTCQLPTFPLGVKNVIYDPLKRLVKRNNVHIVSEKSYEMDKSNWIQWNQMDHLKYLSLLTGASIISSVFSHPFHVVTMQQQAGILKLFARKDFKEINFFQLLVLNLKEIKNKIGIRGLFRGWIPLMLEAPSHALYFAVTESSREYVVNALKLACISSSFLIDPIQSAISSVLANAVSLVPWVPAEVLSSKLALQGTIPMCSHINVCVFLKVCINRSNRDELRCDDQRYLC